MRTELPANPERFRRLLSFCSEVLSICQRLGIEPLLSGSLAVFAYTRDPAMSVNDIDLACSEKDFPRLVASLEARGFACEVKDWHVLQVRREDLKVEFDSIEHWMKDLPNDLEKIEIAGQGFTHVGLEGLKELYRRGLESSGGKSDEVSRKKWGSLNQKYQALLSIPSRDSPPNTPMQPTTRYARGG